MRKEDTASTFEIENQWGKAGEIRTIKTTQQPKSKPAKESKVSNTAETRKVVSKRTEKPSKERQRELIQNAKARVVSNQSVLMEIKKEAKKVAKVKRKPRAKKK